MNDGSSGGGAPSASAASPFFERFRRFAGLAPRAADANAAEGSEDSAEPPSPARSGSSAALRAIQDNVRRLGGYTVADATRDSSRHRTGTIRVVVKDVPMAPTNVTADAVGRYGRALERRWGLQRYDARFKSLDDPGSAIELWTPLAEGPADGTAR